MRRAFHRITRSPLELTLAIAALVAALYAIAAPFAAARYPAMTDLPFHAAQTSTLRHWLDPSFHQQDQFEIHPLEVKAGDTILFGKWSGTEIKIDGEDLIIMKESDILGIVG